MAASCSATKPSTKALCSAPTTPCGQHRCGFLPPDHIYGIPQQLRDGVRGLNLDTYWSDDRVYVLCHGFCELGQQPLVDALSDVKDFLTEQPDP